MKTKSVITLALVLLAAWVLKPAPTTAAEAPAEFADALVLIEYNSHAGDLGFHVELDAVAWKQVAILDPDGNKIFEVTHDGGISEQGLTSLAFESAELPFDVLSWDEFLARFPEGEYTLTGETMDGKQLLSVMEFTHLIPDPPEMISPVDGSTVPLEGLTIAWEPVATPEGVEIDRYQVVLFPVDPPDGQDPIALDIDLTFEIPADITAVEIPASWLMPGEEYQYEVIAVEAEGNKTLTVGFFTTEMQ